MSNPDRLEWTAADRAVVLAVFGWTSLPQLTPAQRTDAATYLRRVGFRLASWRHTYSRDRKTAYDRREWLEENARIERCAYRAASALEAASDAP